jgi:hypothetical protein
LTVVYLSYFYKSLIRLEFQVNPRRTIFFLYAQQLALLGCLALI